MITGPIIAEIATLRVSAHFLIRRGGALVQFVPCTMRAWHAGASEWRGHERCNDFSIGIELEGADDVPYTAKQYRKLARLLEAIRSQPKYEHLPIILMSGVAEPTARLHCNGYSAFLRKPLRADAVLQTIGRLLPGD